jgi:beta-N-acetylhexosaminidase
MSLEHKVAQLFVVRPESMVDAETVTRADGQTREALRRWPVGGLVYFAQNLIDAEQTKAMLDDTLRHGLESNDIPPFLCVDEEGGAVSRIGGNVGFDVANVGDMADIGASDDPALAKSAASAIGGYLKPLGFNVDFAPVCDIVNNPDSGTMRRRSFGDDPDRVARMAAAQVEGLLEHGMLCCAKHFPGIGSATGNSHDAGITSARSAEDLREVELLPFVSAIRAGVPFVMVGHLSLPAVTGDDAPASLSPTVVQGLLREEMGYEGLIITDSLEMGAVDEEENAVLALGAGCDIVLMPPSLEQAINGVRAALDMGRLSEERIDRSVRRVLRTKLEFMGNSFL